VDEWIQTIDLFASRPSHERVPACIVVSFNLIFIMFASSLRSSSLSSVRNAEFTVKAAAVVRRLSGGAGYQNVRDQVLPTEQETEKQLFQHCSYPWTVSVIRYCLLKLLQQCLGFSVTIYLLTCLTCFWWE
jgi:hypothetical protein